VNLLVVWNWLLELEQHVQPLLALEVCESSVRVTEKINFLEITWRA